MPAFKHHIFVCTNTRDAGSPRGCCNPTGEAALHKRFKEVVKERGLKATVRANQAGCLDQCEHGPTVVVYPEGVWYGGVRPDNVAEIVDQHIIAGQPVARLRLAPECINTETCAHKPRR